jgi:hypothetical protein
MSDTKLFHILAPIPRAAGNAFYEPGEAKVKKTLCGAAVTRHDNRFSWQPFPAGDYQPCDRCVELRIAAMRRTKSQALVIRQLIVDELGNRDIAKAICNR